MDLKVARILVGFALLPAWAAAAHPVDDLAHLTAPAEKAASLGYRVAECPIVPGTTGEIDETMVGPPVTSSKWMGYSTWTWSSYPLPDSDETCIVLLEPLLDPLSKSRAAILLMLSAHILPDGSRDNFPALPLGGAAAVANAPPSPPRETIETRWKNGAHPVDELAHLTAPPHKAESLGFRLTDCPIALGSLTEIDAAKAEVQDTLMRGIGEILWTWRNYRVSGSDAMCVELLKPIQEPLSRVHAAILTMAANSVLPNGSVNTEEVLPWPHSPRSEDDNMSVVEPPRPGDENTEWGIEDSIDSIESHD